MKHGLLRRLAPALGLLALLSPLVTTSACAQVGGSYPPQFGISFIHDALRPRDNSIYSGRIDVSAARIDCGFMWQTSNQSATKWFLDSVYTDGTYTITDSDGTTPGAWPSMRQTTTNALLVGDITRNLYSVGLKTTLTDEPGAFLTGNLRATWFYHYFYGPATARRRASGIKTSMPFYFSVYAGSGAGPLMSSSASADLAQQQPYTVGFLVDTPSHLGYSLLDTGWMGNAETNTTGGPNVITSDVPWSGPEN